MRRIRQHNPEHPLLPGLIGQYAAIRQKYSAAVAAAAAAAHAITGSPATALPSHSPPATAAVAESR
jgi:hypothetical protein